MKISISKHIIILITVSLAVAVLFLIYMWRLDDMDTRTLETEANITSNELLLLSQENKQEQLANYIDKAIEVRGTLKKTTFKKDVYTLLINSGEGNTYILCEMQKDENSKIVNLEIGQQIVVKGILKGALLDVILLSCILSETE